MFYLFCFGAFDSGFKTGTVETTAVDWSRGLWLYIVFVIIVVVFVVWLIVTPSIHEIYSYRNYWENCLLHTASSGHILPGPCPQLEYWKLLCVQ